MARAVFKKAKLEMEYAIEVSQYALNPYRFHKVLTKALEYNYWVEAYYVRETSWEDYKLELEAVARVKVPGSLEAEIEVFLEAREDYHPRVRFVYDGQLTERIDHLYQVFREVVEEIARLMGEEFEPKTRAQ